MSAPTYRIKPLAWTYRMGGYRARVSNLYYSVELGDSDVNKPWIWQAGKFEYVGSKSGSCVTLEEAKLECEKFHQAELMTTLELVVPKTWAVVAVWNIMWDDAENGPCAAAEGSRVLKTFETEKEAYAFIEPWKTTMVTANREKKTIYPVPASVKKLKEALGWSPHDEDQMTEDFKFVVRKLEELP